MTDSTADSPTLSSSPSSPLPDHALHLASSTSACSSISGAGGGGMHRSTSTNFALDESDDLGEEVEEISSARIPSASIAFAPHPNNIAHSPSSTSAFATHFHSLQHRQASPPSSHQYSYQQQQQLYQLQQHQQQLDRHHAFQQSQLKRRIRILTKKLAYQRHHRRGLAWKQHAHGELFPPPPPILFEDGYEYNAETASSSPYSINFDPRTTLPHNMRAWKIFTMKWLVKPLVLGIATAFGSVLAKIAWQAAITRYAGGAVAGEPITTTSMEHSGSMTTSTKTTTSATTTSVEAGL